MCALKKELPEYYVTLGKELREKYNIKRARREKTEWEKDRWPKSHCD